MNWLSQKAGQAIILALGAVECWRHATTVFDLEAITLGRHGRLLGGLNVWLRRLRMRDVLDGSRLRGHDDAIVMLGVLQVVFSNDEIASRCGIAGQMCILFGNVMGSAANFHVRPTRFVILGKLVLRFPVLIVIVIVRVWTLIKILALVMGIATPAAPAILLSLPHQIPFASDIFHDLDQFSGSQ